MSRRNVRAEQETIIRRTRDDKSWDIYSAIPRDITRIYRMVDAFDGTVLNLPNGDIRATVPVNALTMRAKKGTAPKNPFLGTKTPEGADVSSNDISGGTVGLDEDTNSIEGRTA